MLLAASFPIAKVEGHSPHARRSLVEKCLPHFETLEFTLDLGREKLAAHFVAREFRFLDDVYRHSFAQCGKGRGGSGGSAAEDSDVFQNSAAAPVAFALRLRTSASPATERALAGKSSRVTRKALSASGNLPARSAVSPIASETGRG